MASTDAAGDHWARVLMWDSQAAPDGGRAVGMSRGEALDGRYGAGKIRRSEILAVSDRRQHVVPSPAARAQRANVAALAHAM